MVKKAGVNITLCVDTETKQFNSKQVNEFINNIRNYPLRKKFNILYKLLAYTPNYISDISDSNSTKSILIIYDFPLEYTLDTITFNIYSNRIKVYSDPIDICTENVKDVADINSLIKKVYIYEKYSKE